MRGQRLSPDQRPWRLPLASGSASCVVVATAGGRADGVTSESEPGGDVWTRVVQMEVAPTAMLRGLSSTDRGIGHGRAGCPERKENPIRSFEVEGQECGYSIDVVREDHPARRALRVDKRSEKGE